MFSFEVKFVFIICLIGHRAVALNKGHHVGNSSLPLHKKAHLLLTDIEIESNESIRILKETQQDRIFILHGAELYHLQISKNVKKLSIIGKLVGRTNELQKNTAAEVIAWRSTFIVVVARYDHLDVYQIFQTTLETTRKTNQSQVSHESLEIQPIQEILIEGSLMKIHMSILEEDQISLLVVTNLVQPHGWLKTYEWMDTFFNVIEEITFPLIHSCSVVGNQSKYIVLGMLNEDQTKISLKIYELKIPMIELKQTLIVSSGHIHTWTFSGENYIASCSAPTHLKCEFFKMIGKKMEVVQNRLKSGIALSKFVSGENFIASVQGKEIVIYVDSDWNCFRSFETALENLTSIMIHSSTDADSNYLLLNYIHPKSALIRVIKIEDDLFKTPMKTQKNESLKLNATLKPFMNTFRETLFKLRSILLKRKTALETLQETTDVISMKFTNLKTEHPIRFQSGRIEKVQITGNNIRSPVQLLHTIWKTLRECRELQGNVTMHSMESLEILNSKDAKKMLAKELYVQNLIYDENLIDGFSLKSKSQSIPTLTVDRFIVAKRLETFDLYIEDVPQLISMNKTQERATKKLHKTRKLLVNHINRIPWSEFYNSLFLKNRDSQISGQIIFQQPSKIEDLSTEKLNDVETRNFFNFKEPQTIRSRIEIFQFFIYSMKVDWMNGINFTQNIARRGVNNLIRTPVNIHEAYVVGDLMLSNDDDVVKRHIFGTSLTDLQQTYTGRVILNGSLTVTNFSVKDSERTNVNVAEQEFSVYDIQTKYLKRNESQKFAFPVTFRNCKITMPQIDVSFLNGHPHSEHLLTTGQGEKSLNETILLIFMFANISEHLYLDEKFPSKLRELSADVIRFGENSVIDGIKYFIEPLTIEKLNTTKLNQRLVNDFVRKSEKNIHFLDHKTFTLVHVKSNLVVEDNLQIEILNNMTLHRIDRHYKTLELNSKLNATDVIVRYINGMPFEKIFAGIEVSPKNGELILHKDVYVEGSVHFNGKLTVDRINGIEWNDYLKPLVYSNVNATIGGEKTFTKSLNIINSSLSGTTLNSSEMFSNISLKDLPQSITGAYTFNLVLLDATERVINEYKIILFSVIRSSNITTEKVNENDVTERYQKAMYVNENNTFDGIFHGGLLNNNSHKFSHKSVEPFATNMQFIERKHKFTEKALKRLPGLLYFDYDHNISVQWSPVQDADAVEKYNFKLSFQSICNHKFLIFSWLKDKNQIYLSEIRTDSIEMKTSNNVQIVAKNYCHKFINHYKSEVSIMIGTSLLRIFHLKVYIMSVDQVTFGSECFILFHTFDISLFLYEIHVLRIDRTGTYNWQQIIATGIGFVTKIFQFANYTTIVSSNRQSTNIFAYDISAKEFRLQQTISDQSSNDHELVEINQHKYHLILKCGGCEYIKIYQFDATESNYFLIQIIKLNLSINGISASIMPDGAVYLFVLPQNESENGKFFNIYRYTSSVQEYTYITSGYFPDPHLILPLSQIMLNPFDGIPVLLLCTSDGQCSVLKAYFQY